MKLGELIGFAAIVGILLMFSMSMMNNGKLQTGINYLRTGESSLDYRQVAREKAQAHGLDPDLFVKQIAQESGFQTDVVSSAGAIGIAQIVPSTAKAWGVDPYDPVAALGAAADHMAWYQSHFDGDYAKALSSYNCGIMCTKDAIARCGVNWRQCIPAETQNYIRVIMGE